MVCCADCRIDLGKVPYEPTERWPIRQQNRKVEQPQTTAAGRRARSWTFIEHDQRGVIRMRAKHRMWTRLKQHAQTERGLVERE
jgi:hypothetical protein